MANKHYTPARADSGAHSTPTQPQHNPAQLHSQYAAISATAAAVAAMVVMVSAIAPKTDEL